MKELVSIVVPVYNAEAYLHRCIDSILNQTYQNIEVILVDDESPDRCPEICEEYAKKDTRVRVLHQKNRGALRARQAGVEAAHGSYIGFVDSDDWIESDMYESLLNVARQTGADMVESAANYVALNGSKNRVGSYGTTPFCLELDRETRNKIIKRMVLRQYFHPQAVKMAVWCKLFRRDVILPVFCEISGNSRYAEDGLMSMYAIHYSKSVAFYSGAFYHYERRWGSFTLRDDITDYFQNALLSEKEFDIFFRKYGYGYEFNLYTHELFTSMLAIALNNINTRKYGIKKWIPVYRYLNDTIFDNKSIIVYGAGEIGRSYYSYYHAKDNVQIVAWVDKRYQTIQNVESVTSPLQIPEYEYDYILLAVKYEYLANEIKKELCQLGVPEEKILWSPPVGAFDWMYRD